MNKLIVIGIVAIMIMATVLFIFPEINATDTVEAPFGEWRVELTGITETGEEIPIEPGANTLTFTKDGIEVTNVNIKIYATATGEGYDSCEFDFSTEWIDNNCPQIGFYLWYGNSREEIETADYNGDTSLTIPVGEETLIMQHTSTLADFFTNNPDYDENNDYTFQFAAGFTLIECTYRGVVNGGTPGPWQTEYVAFSVTSDVEILWHAGAFCGDSTCEEEPYPGENCMSCTNDCGTCNGRILPSDREFTVEDSSLLQKDSNWDIQRTYYTGSGWSGYSQGNTNWEHVEIYEYNNNFVAYVYPYPSAVGSTLNGQCRVRELGDNGNILSGWFNLPQVDDPDQRLGTTITSSDVDNGVTGWWRTNWRESHRLHHNGRYEMEIHYWLDGTGSPDPDPDPSAPIVNVFFTPPIPSGTIGVVGYTLNDPDDSTVNTDIDWGEAIDSYSNEASNDDDHQHNHYYDQSYIDSHTGVWVKVTATDGDGLEGSDTSWLQFPSSGGILINPQFELIDNSRSFQPYRQGNKYLGRA